MAETKKYLDLTGLTTYDEWTKATYAKKNHIAIYTITLSASSWSAEGTYSLTIPDKSDLTTSDINISLNYSENTTALQIEAWSNADLFGRVTNNNTILLQVYGTTPTVDLPIYIVIEEAGSIQSLDAN